MRTYILLLLLSTLLLAGCGQQVGQPGVDLAQRRINVTTTVGMIGDIVKNVGGERVDVTALMGPGVDPHLYKPSASDVGRLEGADVIFYGGLDLEGRMTELFEKIAQSGKPTIAVSDGIDRAKLRQPAEFKGRYDPHIWFDVTLWQDAARTVGSELAKLDPAYKELYERNTASYLQKLEQLHEYVKAQVALLPAEARVLITAHDAFGYFGQQYGFEVRGLQGTSTASEAGAGDVQKLTDFIVERKVKAIFVESSVPQATIEAVQAAVRDKGWDVAIGGQLFSDAMGADGTPQGTYDGMVRHNIDTIVGALK